MKNIRKTLGTIILVLAICFAFTSFRPIQAKAASAVSEQNFQLTYISSDCSSFGVSLSLPTDNRYYADTQILYQGNVIAEATDHITYASITGPFSKNAVYEYRIRIHQGYGANATDYSGWSATRVFTTFKPNKLKLVSKYGRTVKTRIPTVAGAKKIVLKMSTKKNSGFKNVATFKKGKTFKISKYRGTTFIKYKNYYYKYVIYAADGRKCENDTTGYFYIH